MNLLKRESTYYYWKRIPVPFDTLIGKGHIKVSLRTKTLKIAKLRANLLSYRLDNLFIKGLKMDLYAIRDMINAYIKEAIIEYSELDSELPLFVLSIWLAITANSLLHSIGDVFSKEIILGMLENNAAGVVKEWSFSALLSMSSAFFGTLKIYLLNGFMEVVISLFAIVIIYKLIISLHTAVFDGLELKGTQTLDDAVAGVRNEMNFGGKI